MPDGEEDMYPQLVRLGRIVSRSTPRALGRGGGDLLTNQVLYGEGAIGFNVLFLRLILPLSHLWSGFREEDHIAVFVDR